MKDSILPHEVIDRLYCPECSGRVSMNSETMVADNGWVIEFDMDVARLMGSVMRVKQESIHPDMLFDQGWCTWNGMSPEDFTESVKERSEIIELAKISPKRYLEELRSWSIERAERLHREGWRKAAEPVAA